MIISEKALNESKENFIKSLQILTERYQDGIYMILFYEELPTTVTEYGKPDKVGIVYSTGVTNLVDFFKSNYNRDNDVIYISNLNDLFLLINPGYSSKPESILIRKFTSLGQEAINDKNLADTVLLLTAPLGEEITDIYRTICKEG